MKMNTKKFLLLTVAFLTGTLSLFAQSNERGIDLYNAELYDAAKLFFERQTNQTPQLQAENYYYLGQTYFELGDMTQAASYYKKAQETDSSYPFGYIGEGRIALKNGNKKEAETLFKKASGLAKKNPAVETAIAENYIDAGMDKEMEDALKKAEKYNKKYPGIAVVRGNKFEREGNMGEAGRWYENAILFDPTNKEAYLKFARGYKNLNRSLALQKLDELLAIDPNYIPAYAYIGDINYQLGNYKSAIEAYEKFISIPGVPIEQKKNYAQLLYFTDQYQESLNQIQQVLKEDPNDVIMLRLQAYNYYKLEDYNKGLQAMNSFLSKADPKMLIYLDYTTLARLHLGNKEYSEALAAYQKAETIEGANLGEIYREMTTAYEGLGDYPNAIVYYEKYFNAEGTTPVSTDYFFYGSACYAEATNYFNQDNEAEMMKYVEKGDKAFEEVTERSPDSYLGYFWRARINSLVDSRQQKLTDKMDGLAKPYYEKAIEIMEANNANGARNKDLIEAYYYLGSYYIMNKNNDLAGEYFKKILSIDPAQERAQSILKSLGIKY